MALVTLASLPAAASAADTFGSRFKNEPNDGGCNGLMTTPCTYVAHIHPSDPDGDPYAGGAPRDGVIIRFRIAAYGAGGPGTPATVTFRVAELTPTGPGSATAAIAATGPTVTVAGTGAVEEFPARVPVRKGQQLAIDTADARAVYASSGSKFTYGFAPALVDGAAPRPSDLVTEELLVGAVVEPDADGDGYGDESQDACPGSPSAQPPCAAPADRTRPRLDRVRVGRPGRGGARPVRFRLSEAARVALRVERATVGHRVGGRCRRPRAGRTGKRCVRWTRVATLSRSAHKGVARVRIPGRALRAKGRYRVSLVATDTAGNRSTPRTARFRVR